MFALIAVICFLLAAFGLDHLGPVFLPWLGLAFLALHGMWAFTPWNEVRNNPPA